MNFELHSHSNADLTSEESNSNSHIAEAIQYRSMDRRLFG
jgi:predicted ATPase with chaperone activity